MSKDPRPPQNRLNRRRPIQYMPLSPRDFTCELIGEPVGRPELADFMVVPPEWLISSEYLEELRLEEAEQTEAFEGAGAFMESEPVDAAERELLEHIFEDAGRDGEEIVLHSLRVGMLSEALAKELGAGDEAAVLLRRAAILHDVGKIAVPEEILEKPGFLHDHELEASKLHTVVGAELLDGSTLPVMRLARVIALQHHERWDGTGYPDRLKGMETAPLSRVVAVADVFDALTHERPYKPAWSLEEAATELLRQRGKLHEPCVVDALMRVLEKAGVEIASAGKKARRG